MDPPTRERRIRRDVARGGNLGSSLRALSQIDQGEIGDALLASVLEDLKVLLLQIPDERAIGCDDAHVEAHAFNGGFVGRRRPFLGDDGGSESLRREERVEQQSEGGV